MHGVGGGGLMYTVYLISETPLGLMNMLSMISEAPPGANETTSLIYILHRYSSLTKTFESCLTQISLFPNKTSVFTFISVYLCIFLFLLGTEKYLMFKVK